MNDSIRWSMRAVMVVGLIGLPAMAAREEATTAPSATRPADAGARRPGVYFVVDRLKRAVGQLDLSDDQKTKVAGIFDQATQQAQELAESMRDDAPPDRYQKVQDFGKQIRGQVEQVLSDDQKSSLDQKLASGPGQGGAAGGRQGGMLENLQLALDKLDLSTNQKQEVKDLMESTREQVGALRQKAGNGENIQADMQQIRQDVRTKLEAILTTEQMKTLTQAIQQARQDRGGVGNGQNSSGQANGGANGSANRSATGGANGAESGDRPTPADLQTSGPEVGSGVPNVKLVELSGNTLTPAKYKGHVLVLEFGSFSCPVFRDQVEAMEKLKTAEGSRAFFMVVYTREAFPAGDKDVQRNKEESVSVPLATSLEQRKMQAQETQRNLRITIPMAVDTMDDSVSSAFGGFPNGAIVIGKDGNIAAREQWTNPDSLRHAIDEANEAPVTTGH